MSKNSITSICVYTSNDPGFKKAKPIVVPIKGNIPLKRYVKISFVAGVAIEKSIDKRIKIKLTKKP